MMEEAGKGVAVALQENLRALAAEEAHRLKAMINLISKFSLSSCEDACSQQKRRAKLEGSCGLG